jgi:hypothetical protein
MVSILENMNKARPEESFSRPKGAIMMILIGSAILRKFSNLSNCLNENKG